MGAATSQGREVPSEAYDLGTSLIFGQLWESAIRRSHGTCLGDCGEQGKGSLGKAVCLEERRTSSWRWGDVCPNGWPATAGAYGLCGLGRKQDQSVTRGPGMGQSFWGPHVLLTIPSVKVNIQGQRKAALTHIYIKNKSLNYLSSFARGLSFYVPAPLRSISVRIKSYSPLGYVCGVVKNTDAKLTGCGTQQLIELIMTRSDLFLISNYVHLGCAGYMILVLMTAPVVGLSSRPLPTQDYKWGGKGHCLTLPDKVAGSPPHSLFDGQEETLGRWTSLP